MQVTAGAFGGGVAAFGLARLIWDFGATRSLESGYVSSPRLFIYVLPVALVGWLLMRWLTPREMRPTAQAVWTSGRHTFLALALVLPGAVFASGGSSKSAAYLTALKSDLRALERAEQQFHKDSGSYTANLELLDWKPSSGAHAPTITAGPRSWSAINTHTQLGERRCGTAVGTVNPITATLEDGIVCAPLALPLDKASVAFNVFLIAVGLAIGAFF